MQIAENIYCCLPENYTVRPATLDDIDDVVNLENRYWIEIIGKPLNDAGELLHLWKSPIIDIERDSILVFTEDNKLAGLAYVEDRDPHVKLEVEAHVDPAYTGKGIGTFLIGWFEERSKLSINQAPEESRVIIEQFIPTVDHMSRNFLEKCGYKVARFFSRMEMDIKSLPTKPEFPKGVSVISGESMSMSGEEFNRAFAQAQNEIFKDHWGFVEQSVDELVEEFEHWEQHKPNYDPSMVFVAMDGNEMVGQIVCTPSMSEDPEKAYVEVVGVKKEWRKKGIALAMLRHVFRQLYQRNIFKVCLDVDSESLTGATRLYEKAGMHVAWQEVNFEKQVRPGINMATI